MKPKKKQPKPKPKRSKILLPAAVDITIRPVNKKSLDYHLYYWEGFHPGKQTEAMITRTMNAIGQVLAAQGTEITLTRSNLDGFIGIALEGTLSKGKIGDMLGGEFLGWSDMADKITLRKMLMQITINMAQEGDTLHRASLISRPEPPMPERTP